MNKKFIIALEIIWLIIAILSLIAGLHKTYYQSFSESYLFFIITFIAILMYSFRRYKRKS